MNIAIDCHLLVESVFEIALGKVEKLDVEKKLVSRKKVFQKRFFKTAITAASGLSLSKIYVLSVQHIDRKCIGKARPTL